MKWVTANRFYLYNPTHSDFMNLNYNYKHFFLITDIEYINTQTNLETYISNLVTNISKKSTFRCIIIRPHHISKEVMRNLKQSIRTVIGSNSRSFVESVSDFYIKTDSNTHNVFRITSIPNTMASDFLCCGTDNMFDKSVLLRISGLVEESIVDGIGVRFVVFTQGCPHHCEGCHNPQTWDYKAGMFITIDSIYEKIIKNPMLNGVTFSGGEPFMQAESLWYLYVMLKHHYATTKKKFNFTCYTGFSLEELKNVEKMTVCTEGKKYIKEPDVWKQQLLFNMDYIVDGKFMKDKKSLDCKFRGSSNQKMFQLEHSKGEPYFKEIFPCS